MIEGDRNLRKKYVKYVTTKQRWDRTQTYVVGDVFGLFEQLGFGEARERRGVCFVFVKVRVQRQVHRLHEARTREYDLPLVEKSIPITPAMRRQEV